MISKKKKGKIVAVKERLTEAEIYLKAWNEEIKMLIEIEKKCVDLTTPRLIAVLNDTSRKQDNKFIVMEWVEGGSLKNMKPHTIHFRDLLHLFLVLLKELGFLHSSGIIHRDIKPGKKKNYLYKKLILATKKMQIT